MKEIRFHIRPEPASHYYYVEMEWATDQEVSEVFLPAWTPGSYMIRDYSKHLHSLHCNHPWEQIDLSRWKVKCKPGSDIKLSYCIYAFEELTVRTNHLEEEFGLIQPTALFLCPDGWKNAQIQIYFDTEIFTKIYSQLRKNSPFLFIAEDYNTLYDSPFFLTNLSSEIFTVAGLPHEIVIQGTIPFGVKKQLIDDLTLILERETLAMGGNPNSYYLFVLILVDGAYGGLEHLASSVNIFNGNKLSDPREYKKLLELLSHEYYHIWNGKRIRPFPLQTFDYERPNLTHELWITEGITSFYDAHFLLATGILSESEYLEKVSEDYFSLLDNTGEEIMSLEESSFTAWNKLYKRTKNSLNTSVSYYTKGSILALCMNVRILEKTKGKLSLIHVMRKLYEEYCQKPEKGFTKEDFFRISRNVSGFDIYGEFCDYLEKPVRIPLPNYLSLMGIEYFEKEEIGKLGISLKEEYGSLYVDRLQRKYLSKDLNLYLGDEVLAFNRQRVRSVREWEEKIQNTHPDEDVEILLSRRGKIYTVKEKIRKGYKERGFRFKAFRSDTEKQLWEYFLQ